MRSLLILALLLCSINPLFAQPTEQTIRPDTLLQFGRAVAVHNGYAIVNKENFGTVQVAVFKQEGDTWNEIAQLVGDADATSNEPSDAAFSAAMDGDRALWGAPTYDYPSRANGGIAYIFKREGDAWTREGTLSPTDFENSGDFGLSVALEGDVAIVGSPDFEENSSLIDEGAAYIFRFDGAEWVEEARLLPGDREAGRKFGFRVDISGDYAIVGVNVDNEVASLAGAAYLFERVEGTWTQKAKLTASDADILWTFGSSVAIDGSRALIGARSATGSTTQSGAAYVFDRVDTSWVETGKLTASDGVSSDFFGDAVALDGSCAAIGAFNANSTQGAVYVFAWTLDSWIELHKLEDTDDSVTSNQFGISLSLSDNVLAVGAPFTDSDTDLTMAGSVLIYEDACTPTNTSVTELPEDQPEPATLFQNYPNPFSQSTTITFSLTEPAAISVSVYNLLGQKVRNITNQSFSSGTHKVTLERSNLPGGIYFYKLIHNNIVHTRKMAIVQ